MLSICSICGKASCPQGFHDKEIPRTLSEKAYIITQKARADAENRALAWAKQTFISVEKAIIEHSKEGSFSFIASDFNPSPPFGGLDALADLLISEGMFIAQTQDEGRPALNIGWGKPTTTSVTP